MSDNKEHKDVLAAWNNIVKKSGEHPRAVEPLETAMTLERKETKIDRRTLRRTGRTEQLNVRVREETKLAILKLAEVQRWKIGEVIERAIEALDRTISDNDLVKK